jgi:uncharacterized protein
MVTTEMPIINKTKKTTVAKRYRICRSVLSKARGLMFTEEETVRYAALLFDFKRPARQGLHMLFVFYPIDVVFLDEKRRVVDVKEGFRPFTLYNSADQR